MLGHAWIDSVNTTNFRIVVSTGLFVCYVLGAMGLAAFGRPLDQPTLYALGTSILVAMGIDVKQWIEKRRTTIVTPPAVMATDAGAAATAAAREDAAP